LSVADNRYIAQHLSIAMQTCFQPWQQLAAAEAAVGGSEAQYTDTEKNASNHKRIAHLRVRSIGGGGILW